MTDSVDRLATALAGRYTIERELGRGGMATVYLAEDVEHRRRVAIKVLRPELAAALGPDRFLREIETTASLRHPHILPLHDSGRTTAVSPTAASSSAVSPSAAFLYYVMPYVEGESLRDRLDRVPHAATVRPLPDGSRSRFLRAELELAVGDPAVARNYLIGLDDSWSFWDTYYRPHVYRRLAELAEREGRAEDARRWYARLIDTWRECDPELLGERAEVERRREALQAQR